MNKIEQELFDLEELLMRNDDVADRSIYITIGGIANDVSELESENAKLRDAMFTNAESHALQHMDEDESRIFATQQAELINELKELAVDMWTCVRQGDWDCSECPMIEQCVGGVSEFLRRMRELGIEAGE